MCLYVLPLAVSAVQIINGAMLLMETLAADSSKPTKERVGVKHSGSQDLRSQTKSKNINHLFFPT